MSEPRALGASEAAGPARPGGRSSGRKGLGPKLGLAAAGTLAGFVLIEAILRLLPFGGALFEREMFWLGPGGPGDRASYVLDPEFGFRPRLGDGVTSEFGTRVNDYELEKRPGVERLLFVGDSVTFRGKLVDALKQEYGPARFEYWNAGVDSFNTIQEVNYYKAYNAPIRPDHVILSFHNNDFETTPVAFLHEGQPVIYAPNRPLEEINPWLFRHSHLYRVWVGLGSRNGPSDAIVAETEASLLELKRALERDSIRLSIVLLPIFAPESEWLPSERRSRDMALAILEKHGFRYFDTLDAMNQAIRAGVDVQEYPDDRWHPSAECARYLARYLHEAALLDGDASSRSPAHLDGGSR